MKKIYKYGFWFFMIMTITLLNIWNITKKGCEQDNNKCNQINEQRISSLMSSNIVLQRRIGKVNGENIFCGVKQNNLLNTKTIVILLSGIKCDKCQEKELKRLNELKNKVEGKGIEIIGITTLRIRNQVAIQKKILKLDFPIYWIDEATFSELSISDEYPQIIYVKDNIIQSSFIPVTLDDKFSEMYYRELYKVIEKSP